MTEYQTTRRLFKAGKTANYFQAVARQPPHQVLIGCRVSPDQRRDRSDSLAQQEQIVRLHAALAGCHVVGVVAKELSGTDALWWDELKWQADQTDADAIWFTEVTRACRNVNKMLLPTEEDLKRMRRTLGAIKLITVCPPSATMSEIMSWRETVQQKFDKSQRQIWAKRMRDAGATVAEVMRVFGVSRKTVQTWK